MYRSAVLFIIAACATTSAPPRQRQPSRGLRADEHLDAAREHRRRADELSRWPEARRNDVGQFDDPNSGLWYRAWDQADEERTAAANHQSAAAHLHANFDEACANIAPERARSSPLQRYGIGGLPTEDGVIVYLRADAGPPARLLAELRCHRAWMMLADAGMDACPLDLPRLHLQAYGDKTGISVEIRVHDKALVDELQRRTARELEVAGHGHGSL
jgi:hypothetical protein